MDYASVHIRLGQELREVHKLANEGDLKHALQKAVDVRELASELVYALNTMNRS